MKKFILVTLMVLAFASSALADPLAARKLEALFPDIDHQEDYKLRDDGAGTYISEWNRLEPQPTDAEIVAVVVDDDETTEAKEIAEIVQRQQDIIDNLPSWQVVSDSIDNADAAEMKVIVKKLARIVYWLAKEKSE